MLREGLGDELRGLRLALGADDRRQPLLVGHLHHELLALRVLVGHLLLLDGTGEFFAIGEVRDGHIVHEDIELLRPLHNAPADDLRHLLPLCQELLGVVLRHGGLHHLVGDGRKHPLVVVLAEGLVDRRKALHGRLEEHADMDRHNLQVLGARRGLDELRPRPDVVHLRLHHPRNTKVGALATHLLLHALEHVQHDRTLAAIDVKHAQRRDDGETA
mmetsp:Transcript_21524/g.61866  ORF Transcript_21524/g.61866 Transcript_21524/m.61866 type:complete len:216 (+) Transcript_21524:380-1027(+)